MENTDESEATTHDNPTQAIEKENITHQVAAIAAAAILAFSAIVITAEAVGVISFPGLARLLEGFDHLFQIIVGVLALAGLGAAGVAARSRRPSRGRVLIGGIVGFVAAALVIGFSPATQQPAASGMRPLVQSASPRLADEVTKSATSLPPDLGRSSSAPDLSSPRASDNKHRQPDLRSNSSPAPNLAASSASGSGTVSGTRVFSVVLRPGYKKIKVTLEHGIVDDEFGDFQVAPNQIAPMAPAALGDPDSSGSCGSTGYDEGGRDVDAYAKAVLICGKTKGKSYVELKIEPNPDTADDGDRKLTVTFR